MRRLRWTQVAGVRSAVHLHPSHAALAPAAMASLLLAAALLSTAATGASGSSSVTDSP